MLISAQVSAGLQVQKQVVQTNTAGHQCVRDFK